MQNVFIRHDIIFIKALYKMHCATAFSMQSYAESADQPYADGYH